MIAAEFDVLNSLCATASDKPYLRNSDLFLNFQKYFPKKTLCFLNEDFSCPRNLVLCCLLEFKQC